MRHDHLYQPGTPERKAYNDGLKAYWVGWPLAMNPHSPATWDIYAAWRRGWQDGPENVEKSLEPAPKSRSK